MQGQVIERLARQRAGRGQGDRGQAGLVELIHGVVIGAVEIATQQAIAAVARIARDADDAPHRHAHQRQRVRGQHEAALDGLGHDLGGTGGLELFEVAVVQRAHHHRHAGRMGLHEVQDLQRRRGVVVADDDGAGARQAGGHQALHLGGVAEHHALAGGGGLAHAVGVEVQRHVGDALSLQQPREVLARAAVAADDDVGLALDALLGDGGQLHGLHQPVAAGQLHHDAVAVHHDDRRDEHGQHHAGQHRADPALGDQVLLLAQRQQHEAELAGLRQEQARAQRRAGGRAEQPRQPGDQRRFGQHRQRGQQDHQPPAVHQRMPVQLHADGDEEQAEQHVVEGPDVGLHLVLVFGLGDQHAGDEGAQRQAQAGMLGQPGQAQRDQQQVEHEELVALAPRHQREPPAHQLLAAIEQQGQQHHRLEPGPGQGLGHLATAAVQRRDQHQQRHHGQVLEQQHAHHQPAMRALQLQPLGQQLDDDGGRAHRHRRPQHQRALPAQLPAAAQHREPGHQQRIAQHRAADGQHHLHQAQAEHGGLERAQLGQVELQPDDEHQEHDAELGEIFDAGRVVREGQGIRPDQHPHRQITQHRRQLQRAAGHHTQHGGHEVEQGEVEGGHEGMVDGGGRPG
mmetsp:Transcript_15007/g.58786  ORF Transcript_15007/g.58786 Transcript_15007/m.58786 type:complete len:626 (+) Transcript_15007:2270-4147(+)